MGSAGERKRVLIIVQNLPVPFDRRVWLEATTLQQSGYTVSVISPKAEGFDRSYELFEGVHIHRYSLPIEARRKVGYVAEFAYCFLRTLGKSLRIAIRGPGFDVIQACNPPDTYWAIGLFWRLFGKRFVFDHHDLSPEMYAVKFGRSAGLIPSVLTFLERMSFRTADVAIATNESHRRIAIQRGGMEPDQVFVVRSGPDLERLTVYPGDEAWKRGREHLLVYLGEMCEQDGVEYLVRGVEHLRRDFERDDVHCVLVGGGPHQERIRAYAAERGVSELCTFTGRVSDEVLCRVLSSADLAVDPSPKTPWSDRSTMNKVMEYMFFGLPIVCFDLAENRYSAQEAAVCAESNDPLALAACINRLLDDPARRARMSEYGQRRVREELAWRYSAPHLLAAYETVLPRGSAARTRYSFISPST
ncbi:MAG TPA: glycosyltransferase family 4 protein [Gemmatimonadota bacterium]|nr:glycosyltransferase family 4 protein [Gemmatimonadota bacterium]